MENIAHIGLRNAQYKMKGRGAEAKVKTIFSPLLSIEAF